MKVSLKWITPEADKMIAHMARVVQLWACDLNRGETIDSEH